MTAEEKFKDVIRAIVLASQYPSPMIILAALGDTRRRHNLNGRQCRWRAEILREMGWTYSPWDHSTPQEERRLYRWQPPVGSYTVGHMKVSR